MRYTAALQDTLKAGVDRTQRRRDRDTEPDQADHLLHAHLERQAATAARQAADHERREPRDPAAGPRAVDR